jgi:hypothetical protein
MMREPTYPTIVALALMLVAGPSFSAFAQRGERGRILEKRTPLRTPEEQTPLRTQTFGDHVYHGQLAWKDGHWHHATRNGRDGWWWDVGGFWYFYPEQIEGPPDYVSNVEVADDTTTAPPALPQQSNYAVYYRPGDLTGTRYQTLRDCWQAREQAGNVGECIFK